MAKGRKTGGTPLPTPAPDEPPRQVTALVRDTTRIGSPMVISFDGLVLVQQWASEGASNHYIAQHLGISRTTFRELRARQPEVDDALNAGRAVDENMVANVLRAKALAGDTVAMLFYLKAKHGWREGVEREPGGAQVNVQVIQLAAPMTPEQYNAHLDAEDRARAAAAERQDEDSKSAEDPTE